MEMVKQKEMESKQSEVDDKMEKEPSDVDGSDVTTSVNENVTGGANLGWINFMSIIKEKEKEMGIADDGDEDQDLDVNMNSNTDDNGNDNNKNDDTYNAIPVHFNKYKAGGADWELTADLNQPKFTDPAAHPNECPYCKKIKQNTMSSHNWSRHLNARHVFKCRKCVKYFTRHQQLAEHIKQCSNV